MGTKRARWSAAITLVSILIVAGAGMLVWQWISAPLYSPGTLPARADLTPVSLQAEGPWQVAPQVAIAHMSMGAGRNVLVVHGGPGIPPVQSAPALDALSESYRFHYYDQRGSGGSTRVFDGATSTNTWENIQALEGSLGIGEQLADIERIRQILGDDALWIVGHSYGALLAALYAAELPLRVDKLVLIAPADLLVFPSPHGGLFDQIRARLPETQHIAYDAWKKRYLDLGSVFEHTTAELESLDAELIPYFEAASGPMPAAVSPPSSHTGVWHARAQYFSMGRRHDWSGGLAQVTAPVLIVHGEQDLQPLAVSERYEEAFPNAEAVTIEGAGHFPHYTHPEAVVPLLRGFLAD